MLGTGCSPHRLIFMPRSEKQNHRLVKAAFLCLYSILDENKSISVSFDLPHFLTDTFWMLTSIWAQWVPTAQPGPRDSLGNHRYNQQQRSGARMGRDPSPFQPLP